MPESCSGRACRTEFKTLIQSQLTFRELALKKFVTAEAQRMNRQSVCHSGPHVNNCLKRNVLTVGDLTEERLVDGNKWRLWRKSVSLVRPNSKLLETKPDLTQGGNWIGEPRSWASGKIENWNPEFGIGTGIGTETGTGTGIWTGMERGNYIKIGTTFMLI